MHRLLAAVVAVLAVSLPVQAADYMRGAPPAPAPLPSSSNLPACDDLRVLDSIVEKQAWAEARTWRDGVLIEAIVGPTQNYNTTQFASMFEHRHCQARADLTLERTDTLYYTIFEDQGFAGRGWNVEFCMPRHDRWRVYDASCRVLR
jgi:hypothetical protein